ncbi:TldD/PmbA family protein [Methanomassiliicoccus luminyensis]|uniref:TldD/PmbA family protein n=1 Tax=Methanomassiliicoccus luminyensis TaxID=1080712 RepID=UPI0003674B2E|nr:TldD/PmbA family protein [Methanomassiliicoccus luminyensis]
MEDVLEKAVERMRDLGAGFCDARFQDSSGLSIRMSDREVRTLADSRLAGVCLRARVGGSWGYASAVRTDRRTLLQLAEEAVASARSGTSPGKGIPEQLARTGTYQAKARIPPSSVPVEEKLALVRDLDKAQRTSPKIINTNSTYLEGARTTVLVNSFGSRLRWEDSRIRLMAMSIASDGGRKEMYWNFTDGTGGMELLRQCDVNEMGSSAAKEAIVQLGAVKPPSGEVTCITDPVVSGLLAHEVMGHASEGDEIVKRRSFLTDMVGNEVANEQITMVDDGTVEGAYGTLRFDDEGTPSSRTLIIEDGVYHGYMHSLETAAEMGVPPTGNGRAQDFGRRMWVRMTNTFFEAGEWTLEEMIEDVKFGVVTDKMVNGMEDPVGGGFEAKSLRGFLIENGEVTRPVRSMTLTGKALDILRTTDAVGDRTQLDAGTCGKGNEDFVPVSSGGPYCRSRITVGGD